MADAALFLLLQEIVDDAPAGVRIRLDGLFVHVMQQVEVKVVHAALFQLLLENGSGIVVAAELVTGVFGGQIEAAAVVVLQHTAHDPLGHAAVIGIGGVEIVDAMLHGIADHVRRGLFVDVRRGAAGNQRQTHGAEAQQGQLFAVKVGIDHVRFLPIGYICDIIAWGGLAAQEVTSRRTSSAGRWCCRRTGASGR